MIDADGTAANKVDYNIDIRCFDEDNNCYADNNLRFSLHDTNQGDHLELKPRFVLGSNETLQINLEQLFNNHISQSTDSNPVTFYDNLKECWSETPSPWTLSMNFSYGKHTDDETVEWSHTQGIAACNECYGISIQFDLDTIIPQSGQFGQWDGERISLDQNQELGNEEQLFTFEITIATVETLRLDPVDICVDSSHEHVFYGDASQYFDHSDGPTADWTDCQGSVVSDLTQTDYSSRIQSNGTIKFPNNADNREPYYQSIAGRCVTGDNLGNSEYKNTIKECATLCDNTPNCVAFEYGTIYQNIDTYWLDKRCQFESNTDNYNSCDGWENNRDLYIKRLTGESFTVTMACKDGPSGTQFETNPFSVRIIEGNVMNYEELDSLEVQLQILDFDDDQDYPKIDFEAYTSAAQQNLETCGISFNLLTSETNTTYPSEVFEPLQQGFPNNEIKIQSYLDKNNSTLQCQAGEYYYWLEASQFNLQDDSLFTSVRGPFTLITKMLCDEIRLSQFDSIQTDRIFTNSTTFQFQAFECWQTPDTGPNQQIQTAENQIGYKVIFLEKNDTRVPTTGQLESLYKDQSFQPDPFDDMVRSYPQDSAIFQDYNVFIFYGQGCLIDYKLLGPFRLSMCDNNQIQQNFSIGLQLDVSTYIVPRSQTNGRYYKLKLGKFTHSLEPCEIVTYKVSLSDKRYQPHPFLEDPEIDQDGLTLQLDTALDITFIFSILAEDSYGNYGFSNIIQIRVESSKIKLAWAPLFMVELENQAFQIAFENDTNTFSFQIPEVFDANGDEVQMTIKSWAFGVISTGDQGSLSTEFMSFNEQSRLLKFSVPLKKLLSLNNLQQIKFLLADDSKERLSYEQIISVQFLARDVDQTSMNQNQITEEYYESLLRNEFFDSQSSIALELDHFNRFGGFSLIFNETMNYESDISNTTQVLNLKVIPDELRNLDDTFNPNDLQMDWLLTNFTDDKLAFQIQFEDPDEISTLDFEDILNIQITDREFFKSSDLERYLGRDFLDFNVTIPKQMKKNVFTENAEEVVETITDTLKGIMSLQFVMNATLSVLLAKMFIFINCLQVILMLPLNNIRLPPLATIIASVMITICEFDFFPPELTTDHFFDYDEDLSQETQAKFDKLVTKQMQEFNLESHNSIKILGSLFIAISAWYARIIFQLPLLKLYSLESTRPDGYFQALKKRLFFAEIFIICQAGFVPIVLSAIINIAVNVDTTLGEIVGFYLAIFCALLASSLFIAQVYVFRQPMERLQNQEFKNQWGFLYQDFSDKSKLSMMPNLMYTSRRLLLILVAFTLRQKPQRQVVLSHVINLIFACYFMHASPHQARRNNQFEKLNEATIVFLSILYYCLTEMVTTGKERANVGNFFIGSVLLIVLINAINFFGDSLFHLLNLSKYCWNRVMYRIGLDDKYLTYVRPQGSITWSQTDAQNAILQNEIKRFKAQKEAEAKKQLENQDWLNYIARCESTCKSVSKRKKQPEQDDGEEGISWSNQSMSFGSSNDIENDCVSDSDNHSDSDEQIDSSSKEKSKTVAVKTKSQDQNLTLNDTKPQENKAQKHPLENSQKDLKNISLQNEVKEVGEQAHLQELDKNEKPISESQKLKAKKKKRQSKTKPKRVMSTNLEEIAEDENEQKESERINCKESQRMTEAFKEQQKMRENKKMTMQEYVQKQEEAQWINDMKMLGMEHLIEDDEFFKYRGIQKDLSK